LPIRKPDPFSITVAWPMPVGEPSLPIRKPDGVCAPLAAAAVIVAPPAAAPPAPPVADPLAAWAGIAADIDSADDNGIAVAPATARVGPKVVPDTSAEEGGAAWTSANGSGWTGGTRAPIWTR
jgi:hypothetical protein